MQFTLWAIRNATKRETKALSSRGSGILAKVTSKTKREIRSLSADNLKGLLSS